MNNQEYKLDLVVTIVDHGQDKKILAMYRSMSVTTWMSTYGRGTAPSEMMQYLGLGEPEKDVQFAVVPRAIVPEIFGELSKRISIEKPGHGIVFTVPLSSIAGRRALKEICETGNSLKKAKEAPTMEEKKSGAPYEYSLIVTILNSGSAEAVMDAARKAGAGGGTVIHGRGLNAKNAEKFFGFTIQAEKDMLLIVARTTEKDAIMRAIAEAEDMTAEGRGITFSLPVDSLAGISRMMKTEE